MTAQDLFNQCDALVASYPLGTCKLPPHYPVAGRGFFPVASGSFHSGCLVTPITPRKLLFIGQDWGSETNLRDLARNKDADIQSGTGKILSDLLMEANIPLEECFFTNALVGVRTSETNTGASPGWKDPGFVAACSEALKVQIDAIQPKGIVCLGRNAPKLIAKLVEECTPWASARSFKEIDRGSAVVDVTSVPGLVIAAILLHPSQRMRNLRLRAYKGLEKHDAEMKILHDVWSAVSSQSLP